MAIQDRTGKYIYITRAEYEAFMELVSTEYGVDYIHTNRSLVQPYIWLKRGELRAAFKFTALVYTRMGWAYAHQSDEPHAYRIAAYWGEAAQFHGKGARSDEARNAVKELLSLLTPASGIEEQETIITLA